MIAVEAILFDLDGTLIDSRRDLANSVRYLQARYQHPKSSLEQVRTFIGDGVVKLVQRALPALPEHKLPEAIAVFKQHYRDHCLEHTQAYPGVLRTLEHFRHKKLAVVTNKPVRISGYMLEALGLAKYFRVLIGGDSLPQKKPHPEPVRNALRTLQVSSSRKALVVGDSANDILSGRAARARTCALRSNIGDHEKLLISKPDLVISKISELMRFFN